MDIDEAIIETCKSEYNKIFRNYDGLVDTYYVKDKEYMEAQDTFEG